MSMRVVRRGVLVASLAMLLSGCLQTSTLEKSGLIVAVGYDPGKERHMKTTFVTHQVDPRAKQKVQVVSNTADTSKGTRIESNLEMAKQLLVGQLRVALFSEEMAKSGVIDVVDTLSRDASIGTMMYLATCDGKAESLLSHHFKEISNIGIYLYSNLKQNDRVGNTVSTTLHDFVHDYYSVGRDPVMPQFVHQGEAVMIGSLALFNGDKLAGKLPAEKGYYLKLLQKRNDPYLYELKVPVNKIKPILQGGGGMRDVHLVFNTESSDVKMELVDPHKLSFRVQVDIRAELLEITTKVKVDEAPKVSVLEQAMSAAMTDELNSLMQELQQARCDAAGLGEVYLNSTRGSKITKNEWHEMFVNAKIQGKVNVRLVRSGVVQ